MADSIMFTMRMPKAIRASLEKAARLNMRPTSHMALKILADYLVAEGHLRKKDLAGTVATRAKKKE